MFGILKKKLQKVVEAVTKKVEEKEEKQVQQVSEEEVKAEELVETKAEKELEEKAEELIPVLKEEKPSEKKSWIKKITEKIVKKVVEKKLGEEDLQPIISELETDLIEADVAVETATAIGENLKKRLVGKEIKRGREKEVVLNALKESLLEILKVPAVRFEDFVKNKKPATIVFFGFNGSGKTTSIAKVAGWLMKNNFSCVLAAGDTWRAAAEEQLEIHAKNLGVNLIKHKYGADPAAVIFDAIAHAKAKGLDFVLADTAGRAHTNRNLMEQMQKIVRVNKPDLKVLVIDSLTGNDAVLQARMYNEVGVDAVIFTKVDVNEKGGAILSVTNELKKPIIFLGVGQNYHNFEKFDAEKFVNNLLD